MGLQLSQEPIVHQERFHRVFQLFQIEDRLVSVSVQIHVDKCNVDLSSLKQRVRTQEQPVRDRKNTGIIKQKMSISSLNYD